MSILASPRFLRNVLLADAVSCLAAGAAQVAASGPLATVLGLPEALLVATGWFLLAFAALAAVVATRDPVPPALVWTFVAGNAGWALGCAALLPGGLVSPTALGVAWVLAQAVTVVTLADLQWTGLRRGRRVQPA